MRKTPRELLRFSLVRRFIAVLVASVVLAIVIGRGLNLSSAAAGAIVGVLSGVGTYLFVLRAARRGDSP